MRVVQANFVRPRDHADPERLLDEWPTLIDVAATVAEAGVDVTLIQSFPRNAVIQSRGVTCCFVKEAVLPGFATGLSPWRLARAAAAIEPGVIHVNGLDFPGHTRAMCGTGIPVMVQDHASRAGGRRLRRRWGLAKVAGAAFTDVAQAQPFVDEGSLPTSVPIFSVPESSTHFTPGDQAQARATTGLHGDPAVLWVGRLDSNKDPLTILDAVEIGAAELPGLQLWCCYHEQPLLADVMARIAGSETLRDRVHLLGRVPHEKIELLCRATDLFMLGSHREAAGYALLEALACGTIPVVSDIPPFRRLVGNVGVLAPVGDAPSFAAGLVKASRASGTKRRRQVVEHFAASLSFKALGQQLRDVYSALAAASR
jgi:glycosyltransferase involved in cell wall biosynthesis